jgi:hypothetical protein
MFDVSKPLIVIWNPHVLFRLCAWPERVNERTFEVDAGNSGSAWAEGILCIDGIRDVYKCAGNFGFAMCDGGCQKGCRSAFGVCPADGAQSCWCSIHGVCTAATVDMDIHKAWKQHIGIVWHVATGGITAYVGDDAIRDAD